MLLAASPLALHADPESSQLLRSGWMFHAGDIADSAVIRTVPAANAEWRAVELPHDFQIEQPWVAPSADEKANTNDPGANIKSRLSSRGFKEMGVGWYVRQLDVPAELKGKRVQIDFEGIMYTGDVYLNGRHIGGTDYGYVGFETDITDLVSYGGQNILAVKADTREPLNSRWYTGGGLFRDVYLNVTDAEMHFARHPLYITTTDNHIVNVAATVATRNKQDSIALRLTITDPQGNAVYDRETCFRRHRQQPEETLHFDPIEVHDAQLWDCEHPNLYSASVTMYDASGNMVAQTASDFGIRTIEFVAGKGMLLNGEKVLLKGVANHHSLGALGSAAWPDAIEKRIRLFKEFGINHIRTSHNPYSTSLLDLCDRYGILVVDELYDKWLIGYTGGRGDFASLWQHDLPEWVMRDRNHPCVVLWSFGNELQQYATLPFNDWGVTQYKLMRTLLQRYDDSRLSTVAMHPRYRNLDTDSLPADLARVTDIQSYNYRYMYFPGDGRRFPGMKFYQSEASIAAMGPNYFEMDLDKVIGLAYWGALDYLGESQGWPAKGWAQGVFDISLEPKPKAYFMRSFLTDEPLVHIAVIEKKGDMMWNGIQTGNDGMSDHWNRVDGQQLSLLTYTNAQEVELLLNGKSLGRKTNSSDPKVRNQIRWDSISYSAGRLEAVAYNDGKVVARHKIETTGKAVALKGVIEDQGKDLMHVRIWAVDSKGRRVQTAAGKVSVELTGDARIVAMDNGDINSDELHCVSQRSLYNGSVLAIIQRKGDGPVTVRATCDGLKGITIK